MVCMVCMNLEYLGNQPAECWLRQHRLRPTPPDLCLQAADGWLRPHRPRPLHLPPTCVYEPGVYWQQGLLKVGSAHTDPTPPTPPPTCVYEP
jgi:hypothetical protein